MRRPIRTSLGRDRRKLLNTGYVEKLAFHKAGLDGVVFVFLGKFVYYPCGRNCIVIAGGNGRHSGQDIFKSLKAHNVASLGYKRVLDDRVFNTGLAQLGAQRGIAPATVIP